MSPIKVGDTVEYTKPGQCCPVVRTRHVVQNITRRGDGWLVLLEGVGDMVPINDLRLAEKEADDGGTV